MSDKLKVFIVDDHVIFRNGLRTILNKVENFQIVGEVSNGSEFIAALKNTDTDIVLMDIKMPVMDGIEATQRALEIKPDLKIIALSMFGDEEYLQDMIRAGASGFLLKNVTRKILTHAIEVVCNGGNYYSEELLVLFTKKYYNNKTEDDDLQITNREMEVLQLVSQGLTNQEIADKLFISKRTVDGHKNNLIIKTGSKNIVELLKYAIKNEVIKI
ncbi:MAG: response regulator transcription factor [Bacteroidales bacterium]|nr:response regulator transcription factor [Bacteroidales bacterium]